MIIGDDRPDLPLSAPACRLLRAHRPGVPAYLAAALGPTSDPAELVAVDAAYVELVMGGLVAQVGRPVAALPGERRRRFVLTPAGERLAAGWAQARGRRRK